MEETKTVSYRVCVTGGNGLIASYLIKKLMLRGHTVHATLRSLDDESKVGQLKGLPGAETRRLVLFEAGTNRLDGFEEAIRGCISSFMLRLSSLGPVLSVLVLQSPTMDRLGFVNLQTKSGVFSLYTASMADMIAVAPVIAARKRLPDLQSRYKHNKTLEQDQQGRKMEFFRIDEATEEIHCGLKHSIVLECEDVVDGVLTLLRTITKHCVESGTVKRLIYTGSVVSISPMKEDGSGYKDFIDESCFTPFRLPVRYSSEFLQSYTDSKTVASKELLRYDTDQQNGECKGLEVVNLECGLTAGDTILPYVSSSLPLLLSTITNNEIALQSLLYLDELCGRVPIVHMDDVCEAHIFCMEQQSMRGRFLCASSYVSSAEIA
ncbi:hypothetical protein Droror1_Dr00004864 [Drosera rotundifolia]